MTINVGNLTVGGTGKTPHVEWLVRFFESRHTATLSRGYGRKTTGFIEADDNATATTIGDEPLQFYQKFKTQIRVFVCEKRVLGVQNILRKYPQTTQIILDDAFQHRAITPHISILLTDYGRLFVHDVLLPAGLLRERRSGAARASAIIVSKCPNGLSDVEKNAITQKISKYSHAPVFFSSIRYDQNPDGKPRLLSYQLGTTPRFNTYVALSAIAQPQIFEAYLQQHFQVSETIRYPDHHAFNRKNIEHILLKSSEAGIITTEKDFVKISPWLNETEKQRFFYLPIAVQFSDDLFETWITANVEAV